MFLAHDLIERAGAEAGGERRLALELAVGGVGEEAHEAATGAGQDVGGVGIGVAVWDGPEPTGEQNT